MSLSLLLRNVRASCLLNVGVTLLFNSFFSIICPDYVPKIAFERVGLNYQKYLVIDKKYYRKENKINLVADNSFAKKKLKFKPSKSFKEMVHEMIDFELEKLNNN